MLFGIAAILAALTVPGAFVYAIWRFAPVVERFATPPVGIQPSDVAIPEDLIAFVAGYDEAWAQDDVMRAVRERYAEYQDWNKVRTAFGLAHPARPS